MLKNKELNEAERCLACANPFCEKGCPINTPIKDILEYVNKGDYHTAQKILFENNPLSALCGRLCPHEKHCQGNCVLSFKGQGVDFGAIEHELSKDYLKNISLQAKNINGFSVAIVGSGPAGLTSAILLALEGFQVTIYDEHPRIGGILTYGIPQFRYDHNILEDYQKLLDQLNIKVVHKRLGTDITLEALQNSYDFVNLTIGLSQSHTLNLEGCHLPQVLIGTDFLKDACYYDYNKLLVIGTGNVAMDVARSAKRCGAEIVSVIRRRGPKNMSSTQEEIEAAKADGVDFKFNLAPVKFEETQTTFIKTFEDKDGNLCESDEKVIIEHDAVVLAIGQKIDETLMKSLKIKTENGLVKTNSENETNIENVFASGDINIGAKTIVEAVVDAKKTVKSIIKKTANH